MPMALNVRGSPRERGAITPILAVCLVVGLGLLAFSIDLGQVFLGKNELQNIADAAALAGAKKLIPAKDPNNPQAAAVYCDEAVSKTQEVAPENRDLCVSALFGEITSTLARTGGRRPCPAFSQGGRNERHEML